MSSVYEDLAALVGQTRRAVKKTLGTQPKGRVRLEQAVLARDSTSFSDDLDQRGNGEIDQPDIAVLRDPQAPWQMALWSFEAQIKACERCDLGKQRKNFVFGEGKKDARLVFVGEAPGTDEDRLGRPFVGAAGQLLARIIQAMGFRREDVYICNLLKCRPPRNREPLPVEVEKCRPFVEHQIKLVQPEVVVTLGHFAAQSLLQKTVEITQLRGQWQQWQGIPLMPTFHPADLVHDSRLKRQVWDDMKRVMKKLEGKKL